MTIVYKTDSRSSKWVLSALILITKFQFTIYKFSVEAALIRRLLSALVRILNV